MVGRSLLRQVSARNARVAGFAVVVLLVVPLASGTVLPTLTGERDRAEHMLAAGADCLFEACREWVARYNGPGNDVDAPTSLVVSPDGARVFVTGLSFSATTSFDFATAAYGADNGTLLWLARYDGAGGFDSARSVTTDPTGSIVYVTGVSMGSGTSRDFATVAYHAANGTTVWTARYNGPANLVDFPHMVRVSQDGSRVFVTGESSGGAATAFDIATVAYDAATGVAVWTARYDNVASADKPSSLAVGPDGTRVFVTGQSRDPASDYDVVVLAFDATTGEREWVNLYNGPGDSYDHGGAIAVDATGGRVFVAGPTTSARGDWDYTVMALDATNGTRAWLRHHDGLGGTDSPRAMALSHDGTKVVVTGTSPNPASSVDADIATVALDAFSGDVLWGVRQNGFANGGDTGSALAIAPDDSRVYVAGDLNQGQPSGFDMAALAYDLGTGALAWSGTYNGPSSREDYATAVGLSPDGTWLYMTGASMQGVAEDYATMAYRAVSAPVPDPPLDLVARPGDATGEVVLEWSPPAEAPESPILWYTIYRALGDDWQTVGQVMGATTFTDTERVPVLANHYHVTATNLIGEGLPSNESCSPAAPWPSGTGAPAACTLPVR